MKIIITILLIGIIGCNQPKDGTIITKTYIGDFKCMYGYSLYGQYIQAQDSCLKYNVGDTITFKK